MFTTNSEDSSRIDLVARSGAVVNAPQNGLGTGNVTDTNGNLISISIGGGSTMFFDTLNVL